LSQKKLHPYGFTIAYYFATMDPCCSPILRELANFLKASGLKSELFEEYFRPARNRFINSFDVIKKRSKA
jgi:hypothetical protein